MKIEELNQNTFKYNSCKHKSTEMHIKLVKRCSCRGGDYTVEGYFCEAREIFKVTPEICEECPVYESR